MWEGERLGNFDAVSARVTHDDGNGTLRLDSGRTLQIAAAAMAGDGTVPEVSGKAPAEAGVAGCFAHGQGNPGEHNDAFGYEHQHNYNDPRAVFAAFYGVIRIAQLANWHKGAGAEGAAQPAPAEEGVLP